MKTVFSSTNEVAHVWASQTQEHGTNQRGSIYFNGRTIYSYGGHFPMAHFYDKDPNVVFINSSSYSVSTSQHQNHVRSAINHKRRIYVPECVLNGKGGIHQHEVNVEHFLNAIELYVDKQKRARKYDYRNQVGSSLAGLKEYVDFFRIRGMLTKAEKEVLSMEVDDLFEGCNFVNLREKKAKVEKRKEKNRKEESLNKWAGCKVKYVQDKLYLRLSADGEQIQTTMGANVPVKEAKILYLRIKAGKDVKGFKIGYYTVISINGALKIGCHNITSDEMDRLAKIMGW